VRPRAASWRRTIVKKEAGKKLLEEVAMSNADQIMLKKVLLRPAPPSRFAIGS